MAEGIAQAGVWRGDLFLTSKVDDPFGEEEALASVRQTLAVLNTSYLDLVLMHWPAPMAWDFESASLDTSLVYNQCASLFLFCSLIPLVFLLFSLLLFSFLFLFSSFFLSHSLLFLQPAGRRPSAAWRRCAGCSGRCAWDWPAPPEWPTLSGDTCRT